jgi:hypothetical protein
MSESYLPTYTERPGEQVFRPPYVADGVRLHVCFVTADVDRLNDLIDDSLNVALEARSRGAPRFRATGQPIIFMFAEIAKMYSAADDYMTIVKGQTPRPGAPASLGAALADHPYVPEVELGIWVPISRLVYGKQEPGFYLPFVFNGTPASVVTGREVYGYPKQFADFARTEASPRPLTSMTMQTWHLRSENDREYTLADLLTLTLASEKASKLNNWQAAVAQSLSGRDIPTLPRIRFRAKGTDADDEPSKEPSWDDFVDEMVKSAPLLFLRQFRDPVNPADATVQQIISARFVIQSTPTFSFHPDTDSHIAFEKSQTLDLIKILGLTPATSAERTVAIDSLVVIDELTFTVDLGKVLA